LIIEHLNLRFTRPVKSSFEQFAVQLNNVIFIIKTAAPFNKLFNRVNNLVLGICDFRLKTPRQSLMSLIPAMRGFYSAE